MNEKILIIYKTKYGSTRQYAKLISDAVDSDLFNIEDIRNIDFNNYSTIIFGGYYHMGKINIAGLIKDNWEILKNKKVVLFTTSGTPPQNKFIKDTYEKDFPKDVRNSIKYFPLWGRLNLKKLTLFDKFLMAVGKRFMRDPEMKKGMETNFDGVKQENLKELIEYIKR